MRIILEYLSIGALFLLYGNSHAVSNITDANIQIKNECIGIYQVNFPGDVIVAMNEPNSDGISNSASFKNGGNAPFSQMRFFGYLDVISNASEADFFRLKTTLAYNREKARIELLNSDTKSDVNLAKFIKPLTYDTATYFGWDGDTYMPGLYYLLDKKIFAHSLTNFDDDERRALNKKHFNAFLKGFRLRPLYEIPKQQGICIPYGFIADDGTTPRNIAVTMRLTDLAYFLFCRSFTNTQHAHPHTVPFLLFCCG